MNLYLKPLIVSLLIIPFIISCQKEKPSEYTLDGMVQGSYYHIVYYATQTQNQTIKQDITNIFSQIDKSVSLWHKESIINQVNDNKNPTLDTIFIECFNKSQEISALTLGNLDCTIGALVEKYGFAAKNREQITQTQIDSLLKYVGYKNLRIENQKLIKKYSQTKIDFNAIAQGYTTDKISEYLLSQNIESFIVDVGGEVRANGKKENGKLWRCAIEQPSDSIDSERKYNTYLELKNNSIVTSGNYRKYYIDESGTRKSHTISPFNGKSVDHSLLSASVVAQDATLADGLATAFMVMGLEKTKEFLIKHPHLKAHLIYWENNQFQTYTTENLKPEIKSLD